MVLQRLGGRLSTTTTRRTTPPTPRTSTQPPAPLTIPIPQDLREEEEGEEVILKLTIVYFGL